MRGFDKCLLLERIDRSNKRICRRAKKLEKQAVSITVKRPRTHTGADARAHYGDTKESIPAPL